MWKFPAGRTGDWRDSSGSRTGDSCVRCLAGAGGGGGWGFTGRPCGARSLVDCQSQVDADAPTARHDSLRPIQVAVGVLLGVGVYGCLRNFYSEDAGSMFSVLITVKRRVEVARDEIPPVPGYARGMADNSDTSTVRKPGAGVEARQLLAVHMREPQRLLAGVRLRIRSGSEADLPRGWRASTSSGCPRGSTTSWRRQVCADIGDAHPPAAGAMDMACGAEIAWP